MLSGVEEFIIFGLVPLLIGTFAAPERSDARQSEPCEIAAPADPGRAKEGFLQDLALAQDAGIARPIHDRSASEWIEDSKVRHPL